MAGFYPFGYDVTIIAKVLIDMSIERKLRSQYFKINNWYHRNETVYGHVYAVPININRIEPNKDNWSPGWQVRFVRKSEKYKSCFYSDAACGGTANALTAATNELFRLVDDYNYRHTDELSAIRDLEYAEKGIKCGMPGVSISANFKFFSPRLVIQVSLISKKAAYFEHLLNWQMFRVTESIFVKTVRQAIQLRLFWMNAIENDIQVKNKPSASILEAFPSDGYTIPSLLETLQYFYDVTMPDPIFTADKVRFTKSELPDESIYEVSRAVKIPGYNLERKVFSSKTIGSSLTAEFLAILYANTLQTRNPVLNSGQAGGQAKIKKSEAKAEDVLNTTGVFGVEFKKIDLEYHFIVRTSRTKTNSKSAVFSIEEFGFDGAFRLAAIKARQTNKLSFDEQTINFELETAKQTIQQSHPNLYLD